MTHARTATGRDGYILLLTVLFIGGIATAVLGSLLMLGTSAGQVSLSVQQSNQAFGLSEACAEYALLQLKTLPSYAGTETLTLSTGTCEILSVGGIGNNNRTVCMEGQVGDIIRRIEIVVSQVLPQMKIDSWQEVASFSLCE